MSVARAAAHGVAWNLIFGIGSRALTLVSTLVLTRFVAPEAYGAVLAASITVLTAGTVTSFAFGQYLIARQAPATVAFQAAVVHVVLGVAAMATLYVFRGPIGNLLGTPGMAPFIGWYAIAHLIERARYVPERLLMRDLQFKALAGINATGELAFVAVALAMAWRWGVYAIVVAVLVRAVVTAILFLRATPRREWLVFAPLQWDVVRGMFSYGIPVMIGASADRAVMRWDNLIVSRLFGPAIMAQYGLAYSLAEMPIANISAHIGDVLMPSFSRLDEAQRRSAVVRAAASMAVIAWPLGVGLATVAPTLVDALFDERWSRIAPMLTILGVMTVFLPMLWPTAAYLQAAQYTRTLMLLSFSRAVIVLPLVAALGYAGGPEWACGGSAIGAAAHSLGAIAAVAWFTGLPIAPHLLAVLRPMLACVPMFVAVRTLASGLETLGVPGILSLAAQVGTGGVVYIACAFVVMRSTTLELIRLGKTVMRRGSVVPAGLQSTAE